MLRSLRCVHSAGASLLLKAAAHRRVRGRMAETRTGQCPLCGHCRSMTTRRVFRNLAEILGRQVPRARRNPFQASPSASLPPGTPSARPAPSSRKAGRAVPQFEPRLLRSASDFDDLGRSGTGRERLVDVATAKRPGGHGGHGCRGEVVRAARRGRRSYGPRVHARCAASATAVDTAHPATGRAGRSPSCTPRRKGQAGVGGGPQGDSHSGSQVSGWSNPRRQRCSPASPP